MATKINIRKYSLAYIEGSFEAWSEQLNEAFIASELSKVEVPVLVAGTNAMTRKLRLPRTPTRPWTGIGSVSW